ncbi:MAG: hypothetical protein UU09_C0046G0010 [Microgenomates group bacterium GW2011_GWA2_40_6]|nr:MAG: hypothetical protein UU09_C0046G0010 [Microgenomates group bacterium GW2011_GWA2_40_6]
MKRVGWVVLIVDLILINVVVGWWLWEKEKTKEKVTVPNNSCLVECTALIDKKMTAIPTPSCSCPVVSPTVVKTNQVKVKSTVYVPVNGSGNVLDTKWTDISGTEFYFNPDDYPGLKEAYFEANMKLLNGNGTAFVRLFDSTAGIEVWGSEIKSSSQTFGSVVSGKLTLRGGNHLDKVQAKSLTADTTVFNGGRIKLVVEN